MRSPWRESSLCRCLGAPCARLPSRVSAAPLWSACSRPSVPPPAARCSDHQPPVLPSTQFRPSAPNSRIPSGSWPFLRAALPETWALHDGVPERALLLYGKVVVGALPAFVGAGHYSHPASLALGKVGASVRTSPPCPRLPLPHLTTQPHGAGHLPGGPFPSQDPHSERSFV